MHTKGPWIFESFGAGYDHSIHGNGISIAKVYYKDSRDRSEAVANAHLIAAAPDLLEVCKLALEAINQRLEIDGAAGGAFTSEIKAILLLEKVINKAED